jgi:hypothetical protein
MYAILCHNTAPLMNHDDNNDLKMCILIPRSTFMTLRYVVEPAFIVRLFITYTALGYLKLPKLNQIIQIIQMYF